MLVWYVDDSYADNNVASTPVRERPCPSTPARRRSPTRTAPRPSNRRQPFDATFGLEKPYRDLPPQAGLLKGSPDPELCRGVRAGVAGIPTFNDKDPLKYWSSANPQGSVKVAGHGVMATVTGDTAGSSPSPSPTRLAEPARTDRSRGPASRGALLVPGPLPASRLRAHRSCGRKHSER